MAPTKTHTYKGVPIIPCGCGPNRGSGRPNRWYVQGYHHSTGLPYSEDLCAHAWTLADAR